ncbi:MAG TPA: hypothetical protein VND19_11015 [Acetobacteraceae bacterium]|nr:hypothetical protein [Acetobacteraceae bacterium]
MSSGERAIHRRLIVELCHGGADARTLRAVAEFAALLELDLHGLFIEDAALLALAELPFAREIRLPTHEWQKLDADRIAGELHRAAEHAQRLLHEVAAALDVPTAFQVLRGDPAETIAAIASGSDVIVVAEPAAPGGRLAPGLSRVYEAAHGSAASLLLLPGGFTPRRGPVAVLLAGTDDPSLPPAARAAVNTRERLLVLLPEGDVALGGSVAERAMALGLSRSRVATRTLGALHAEDLLHALGHVRERLVVLTRGASAAGDVAVAVRIAADRGVPVLLVEPQPSPAQ